MDFGIFLCPRSINPKVLHYYKQNGLGSIEKKIPKSTCHLTLITTKNMEPLKDNFHNQGIPLPQTR
jgi:hypothetical protein